MATEFHLNVVKVVKKIPKGKIATYGQVAALAGNPRGARQVVRTLCASSKKEKLPWYRVLNKQGKISLPRGEGYELQKALLEDEGVEFNKNDKIKLDDYQWSPRYK